MRKLPYREGTWFGVPLEGGGFGVGVVARAAPKGGIILAYFFGPKRDTVPTLAQIEGLKARDAVLCIRVTSLGLIRGTWPIIGHAEFWQRSEWPMPVFVRPEGRRVWLVYYADDNPNRTEAEALAAPETTGLGIDSLYGDGAAEFVLTQALTEGRGGTS